MAARRYNQGVTVKEELHQLIDRLADEQARDLLEDLRDAADVDGPPLDEEVLASLDRGLADVAANRMISLEISSANIRSELSAASFRRSREDDSSSGFRRL